MMTHICNGKKSVWVLNLIFCQLVKEMTTLLRLNARTLVPRCKTIFKISFYLANTISTVCILFHHFQNDDQINSPLESTKCPLLKRIQSAPNQNNTPHLKRYLEFKSHFNVNIHASFSCNHCYISNMSTYLS